MTVIAVPQIVLESSVKTELVKLKPVRSNVLTYVDPGADPMNEININTSLANRAILVALQISQWDARRIDKQETRAVLTKHAMVDKAARVHKSLLPGAPELEKVHKYAGDIRTFVYKHTLPWAEGMQILRTVGFIDFTQELDTMKQHWLGLVRDFIYEYPNLVRRAQHDLGTMFDPDDYPDQSDLSAKFALNVKYLPVPESDDWRVNLSDEAVDFLRKNVEDQIRQSQRQAMQEAWSRLYKVVERAHDRLADPKAIFRDSLVENAVELCGLLPSLNIANDVNLERMRQEIERSLCAFDANTLRKDADARAQAAASMKKAMDKMSAFYGA